MTELAEGREWRARRNTIGDALRRSAKRNAERLALIYDGRRWTYSELDRATDRLARYLTDLGLKLGDRVVAYGRNSDAYLLAWLGCVRAGLIHVPVNYAQTSGELAYIVAQCGARAILYDPELEQNLTAARAAGTIDFFKPFVDAGRSDVLAAAIDPSTDAVFDLDLPSSDTVQLLYTSGTTGDPKGAMMTHQSLLAGYNSCLVDLGHRSADRVLAAFPLYHLAQMHCFSMPQLLAGAMIILVRAPGPEECLTLIEAERITSFFAPPTAWINLLRHPSFGRRDLTSIRKLYYGASIMPAPVLREIRERLPLAQLFNCYGQTEIGVATVLRPHDHDDRPTSAGRTVLNVETRVVDQEMNDAPAGVHGEIVHRSPQLLAGYWEKPKETAEAFAGGWFHSGDLGYLDEEGYLYVVDRIKDVINTGGVLVASREVEDVLLGHPDVSEVAVVALPDPKWIEAVGAFIVLRAGASASAETIVAYSRTHLAPYKTPKRVIFVDSLPQNTAGKVLKRELRMAYGGGASPVSPMGQEVRARPPV